jgi:thiol-disulfide isomerase/thioredoxin
MRTALLLTLSLPALIALACSPNEPPKTVDPTPSATPSASVAAAPSTTASTEPSASAAPTASAAPAAAAPVPNVVSAFHAVPVSGGGELAVPAAGKVTYVQFCASWCVPCRKLLPIAQQLHVKYKDKGLVVVAVEEDEAKADVMPFAKKMGVGFPVFWDEGGKQSAAWKVSAMPTGIVVSKTGALAYTQRGYVDGDEAALDKAITVALAEAGK